MREAGERYGKLEDHFEQEKVEHKEEVKRRNDAIRILRKELTDANQLIEDLKHKGMTDEGKLQSKFLRVIPTGVNICPKNPKHFHSGPKLFPKPK